MLAVEAARHACSLPLALKVLGSSLRGKDKEYWKDMMERLNNGQEDKIDKILRLGYEGLHSKEDQAIFRHIACLFNHMEETTIKSLLADRNLGVNMALENLVDKSLIHVEQGYVVMPNSLQAMGRKIVRLQSIDEPGKREFLVDEKDIFNVINEGTGTDKVLGISFCHTIDSGGMQFKGMHFSGMDNLRFLEIYSQPKNHTFGVAFFPKPSFSFYDLLRLLLFNLLPKRHYIPISFVHMFPKLRLLSWERYPMSCMPSNFRPEKLVKLEMQESQLEKLWEGVVPLTHLKEINLRGTHNLKKIPDLSMATNLENLDLGYCSSLVELPSSIRNLNQLKKLSIDFCQKLETLPRGINLESLIQLDLNGCSRFRSFPEISTNISCLELSQTRIEEVPCWVEKFSKLAKLNMEGCSKLKCVSLNTSKLKHLKEVNFSDCGALTKVDLRGNPSIDTVLEGAKFSFMDCFKLDPKALIQQQSITFNSMVFSGEQVPSCFIHRTTGLNYDLTIPLRHIPHSQPFFRFRACAVINTSEEVCIRVNCQLTGRFENSFDSIFKPHSFLKTREGSYLLIFNCCIPLNKDNAPLAQLNYDDVEMKIHLSGDWESRFKIRGWGTNLQGLLFTGELV